MNYYKISDKRKEFNRLGAYILHLEEGHQGKLKPIRIHIIEWCNIHIDKSRRNYLPGQVNIRTFVIGIYTLFFNEGRQSK